jgi:hypothetical protein
LNMLKREQRLPLWYRDARIGLFLTWGMQTGDYTEDPFGPDFRYKYETVESFERAAEQSGWNAGRWITAAKRLRAKYITVASFHCLLGYLKIWPSRVPGSLCTKRDYLRELIDAAEPDGIRIVVYINRDAKQDRLACVEKLIAIAEQNKISAAQLALSWLLNRGDDIIPIIGTKTIEQFSANIQSVDIKLSNEDMERVDRLFPSPFVDLSK